MRPSVCFRSSAELAVVVTGEGNRRCLTARFTGCRSNLRRVSVSFLQLSWRSVRRHRTRHFSVTKRSPWPDRSRFGVLAMGSFFTSEQARWTETVPY